MILVTPEDGTTGTLSIPDELDTSLGKRLVELIQRMFEEACIPDLRPSEDLANNEDCWVHCTILVWVRQRIL